MIGRNKNGFFSDNASGFRNNFANMFNSINCKA